MARPTPVLPEVGSTIVPPCFSFPSRSACSIIARPIRSLTDPPGLRYSSLARIRAWPGGESLSSRTIGVFPTSSRRVGYSRGIARKPRAVPGVGGGALRESRGALGLGGGREFVAPDQHEPGDERGHADPHQNPESQRRSRGEGLLEVALPVLRDQVVEAGRRDGCADRDADRASDLLRCVDESRGETRLVVAHACERRDRDRDEGERQPEADQEVAGKEFARERAL